MNTGPFVYLANELLEIERLVSVGRDSYSEVSSWW